MTQRTFEFRPPAWRTSDPLHWRTGVLLFEAILWLLVYSWLGERLLHDGVTRAGRTELILTALVIVFGVLIVLGWYDLGRRWIARVRHADWPALSLDKMHALSPSQFEDYVAKRIFARQGYLVDNTRDVKDGGIDLLLTDHHGRQAVVQCKRYKGTVGESVIRDLYGTMIHGGATMAFLVTTGHVSAEARKWVAGKPIGLIDGPMLVRLAKAEPAVLD